MIEVSFSRYLLYTKFIEKVSMYLVYTHTHVMNTLPLVFKLATIFKSCPFTSKTGKGIQTYTFLVSNQIKKSNKQIIYSVRITSHLQP